MQEGMGQNAQSTFGSGDTEDRKGKRNDITILSFKISCAGSCSIVFSNISAGNSRRFSGGLPAVIQASGLRAWSVFADGEGLVWVHCRKTFHILAQGSWLSEGYGRSSVQR